MSFLTCGGLNVLSGTIVLTRVGAWYADLSLDGSTAPAGSVQIQSDDGSFVLVGTALFSGSYQAHVDVRVEGGGGGIDRVIEPRYYRNATLRIVLGDALRDAGEQLDSSVDSGLLNAQLTAWTRRRGTLGSVLGDIVRFACPSGTIWRTLSNGNVWLGTDAYSADPVTVDAFDTMDERPSELQAVIATDVPSAALIPGAKFKFDPDLDPGKVSQVEHTIEAKSTRTTLWFKDDVFGDRVWSPLARVASQTLGQTRFQSLYTGTVTAYHDDDATVDVQIDDPTSVVTLSGTARLPDLAHVPIRAFGPSVKVKVQANARVLLGFEGSSPARPVVIAFENTDDMTEVDIGGTNSKVVLTAGTSVVTINHSGDVTIDAGSNNIVMNGGTKGVARLDDTTANGTWDASSSTSSSLVFTYTPPGGVPQIITIPFVPGSGGASFGSPIGSQTLKGKVDTASGTVKAGD